MPEGYVKDNYCARFPLTAITDAEKKLKRNIAVKINNVNGP